MWGATNLHLGVTDDLMDLSLCETVWSNAADILPWKNKFFGSLSVG